MNGILTFNTINDLENIFKTLTPEKYFSMQTAIENNFKLVEKYKIPEDYIFNTYPFLFTNDIKI